MAVVVGWLGLSPGSPQAPTGSVQPERGPTTQVSGTDCVQFQSPTRLAAGTPFRAALLRGLEFRLSDNWDISVGPVGNTGLDYLWVVSPPLRTAPHRMIGAGYGLSARDSARIERPLRFVLTRADYDAARAAIDDTRSPEQTLRTLDRLGRGTLSFVITDYRILDDVRLSDGSTTDAFEWIAFKGAGLRDKAPPTDYRTLAYLRQVPGA